MAKNKTKKSRERSAEKAKSQKPMKATKGSSASLPIGATILKPGNSTATKTGDWRSIKPVRDESKCIYCGICWQYCPDIAIDKNIITNYDYCKGCGICANVCPVKCIKMEKEEK